MEKEEEQRRGGLFDDYEKPLTCLFKTAILVLEGSRHAFLQKVFPSEREKGRKKCDDVSQGVGGQEVEAWVRHRVLSI